MFKELIVSEYSFLRFPISCSLCLLTNIDFWRVAFNAVKSNYLELRPTTY
jgi:hypothetical protein